MEYHGKLYGKIGNKYFDTSVTSKDYDQLKEQNNKMKERLKECLMFFEGLEHLETKNKAPEWLIKETRELIK